MPRTFKFLSFLALFIGLLGTISASAATGPTSGFVTMFNPDTGKNIVIYCENGLIDTVISLDVDGSPIAVGVSIGTLCQSPLIDGFEEINNLDPTDGKWVIAAPGQVEPGTLLAYTCGPLEAPVLVSKTGDDELEVVWVQEGRCDPYHVLKYYNSR